MHYDVSFVHYGLASEACSTGGDPFGLASEARSTVATPSASQARRAPQVAAHLSEHEYDIAPHAYSISCMKPKSMCSCW